MAALKKNTQQQKDYKEKIEADMKAQDNLIASIEAQIKAEEAAANASKNNSSNNSSSNNSGSSNTQPSSGGGGFAWPCPGYYTISSTYGNRWGTTHGAIDIAGGNAGAAIVASKGGTVVRVVTGCTHNYAKSSSCGCGGGYGNYVIIQHDGTYSTLYGHMASVAVSVGQTVSQGQTIGYVGSTGFSTGFHLHFEVRVNGAKVDPMQYLG